MSEFIIKGTTPEGQKAIFNWASEKGYDPEIRGDRIKFNKLDEDLRDFLDRTKFKWDIDNRSWLPEGNGHMLSKVEPKNRDFRTIGRVT